MQSPTSIDELSASIAASVSRKLREFRRASRHDDANNDDHDDRDDNGGGETTAAAAAAAAAAGPTGPRATVGAGAVLNLAGVVVIKGDSKAASQIDLGTFDISGLFECDDSLEAATATATAAAKTTATALDESVVENDATSSTPASQIDDMSTLTSDLGNDAAATSPRSFRLRARRCLSTTRNDYSDDSETTKRRKLTGGLRLAPVSAMQQQQQSTTDADDSSLTSVRQLQANSRLPQRKPVSRDEHAMKPSTLSKLITGIWEQIFSSISFDMSAVADEWHDDHADRGLIAESVNCMEERFASVVGPVSRTAPSRAFSQMNVLCRKISQASRVSRALEVIVQARWIEHFDERVRAILRERGDVSQTKAKMAALAEACCDFGWTEKELRNKMAIWRGYQQIKEEGGWVCLVFAGMGIYRFCKYRIEFSSEAMQALRRYRTRFEVAADTLHPRWREMLSIVDAASPRLYIGHPHDWVVSDYDNPVPLAQTYLQWDRDFTFTHLDTSVVDVQAWGASDPRLVAPQSPQDALICSVCGEKQSDDAANNNCRCFPNLYGSSHVSPVAVQIFRTKNGRNNGLVACCPFERGTAVGEFLGLVTKGLEGVDIMQAEAAADDHGRYQIWQGREGNHTRFVNHSCRPNSQFQRFVWMGVQRIVLVSRGIEAGQEITADYSDSYWHNLEKVCLCNEPCCRFKDMNRARIA